MAEQRPAGRLARILVLLGVGAGLIATAGVVAAQQNFAGGRVTTASPTPPATVPVSPSPSPSTVRPTPTPTPSVTPTPTPAPTPTQKPGPPAGLPYELPVVGSTGFVGVATTLKAVDGLPGGRLKAGQSFTITKDEGKTWIVRRGRAEGRLTASRAMLNLPDVIPSIVYRDVNADASIFQSSGVELPGVTGRRLYESKGFNPKLDTDEFFMPVLYPMVKKIHQAQQAALAEGETLIMYQTFRPHDSQLAVAKALTKLYRTNKQVRAGMSGGGWGVSSFIAVNLSNHQLGIAIDVSLGKVTATATAQGRDYSFTEVEAREYEMQTPMHELSKASASFAYPVRTRTGTAWKKAPLNKTMTRGSKRLRSYMIDAGLTPISSEWWHFDDWDARKRVAPGAHGRYRLDLPS